MPIPPITPAINHSHVDQPQPTTVINHGHVSTLAELPLPAGVEYKGGKVYISYDVFPPEVGPPDGKISTVWVGR